MAITEKSIRQSSIGMKDSGASLHAVWNSLFVPVSTKGKRKQNGIGAVDNYVNRLAFEVQSCGDQDKVVQGASYECLCVPALMRLSARQGVSNIIQI
jgi:chromosome transmission fidelity protein 18